MLAGDIVPSPSQATHVLLYPPEALMLREGKPDHFLLSLWLMLGETEARQSQSLEQARRSGECRSRVRAPCCLMAAPKIQLLASSPEKSFPWSSFPVLKPLWH